MQPNEPTAPTFFSQLSSALAARARIRRDAAERTGSVRARKAAARFQRQADVAADIDVRIRRDAMRGAA
jgi:hypothetical protein